MEWLSYLPKVTQTVCDRAEQEAMCSVSYSVQGSVSLSFSILKEAWVRL